MSLLQLVIKDVKNVLYDPKSLAILIVMPIVIMTILGFSLKNMFSDDGGPPMEALPIAVVKDYDLEKEKQQFVDAFTDNTSIDISSFNIDDVNLDTIMFDEFLDNEDLEIIDYILVDESEIKSLMRSNDIVAAVILPEGFIYNGLISFTGQGRNIAQVQVLGNSETSFYASIIDLIFESFVSQINLRQARNGAFVGDIIAKGQGNMLSIIMENMPDEVNDFTINLNEQSVNKQESINSFQYYAVAIMSMFLLYAASFGGRAILDEKKEYTMARLSVGGISISKMVVSNFIRIAMLSIVQSIVMIIYSYIVLGVNWGNMATVVVSILSTSIVVGAFGMLLSVLTLITGTYNISNIFQLVVIQFMALIGGSFIPVEILPEAISNLSFLSISGLGLNMYVNAMYDLPVSSNFKTLGILLVYTLTLIIISQALIMLNRKKVNAC